MTPAASSPAMGRRSRQAQGVRLVNVLVVVALMPAGAIGIEPESACREEFYYGRWAWREA